MTGDVPVTPPKGERIAALDALRGVALVGILVVNVVGFAGLFSVTPEQQAALPTASIDPLFWSIIGVFFLGKFYSIFSLLFGIGFAIQLARGGATRFRRRMVVLVLIGLLHSLVWYGDILFLYAILGLLLIPMQRLRDRTLLTVAVGMLALPLVSWLVFHPGMALIGLPEMWPFQHSQPHVESLYGPADVAIQQGDLPAMLAYNLEFWIHERLVYFATSGRPYRVFAMFLLGLWLGRKGIPAALAEHRELLRRAARWGLGAGIPLNAVALAMLNGWQSEWSIVVEPIAVAVLAVGYAGGLGLLLARPLPPAWLLGMAPLGRIALTAYLSQTIICTIFFSGLGTGSYGTLGPSLALLVVPPIILLQLGFARWWLARHPQGPVEWAWRRLARGGG